jgi:hypothetical protein
MEGVYLDPGVIGERYLSAPLGDRYRLALCILQVANTILHYLRSTVGKTF